MTPSQQPLSDWLPALKGRLIVSCQALAGEPLHGARIMARMALAAQLGGAAGIRANSPADIRAIRAAVELPIFGLYKHNLPGYEVYITPTLKHARLVARAGADVVCVDATQRPHPDGLPLPEWIHALHEETGCAVMADIATLAEGLSAEDGGADILSTTLSGYTPASPQLAGPDLELVRQLAARASAPVFAEGRYHTPDQAAEAIRSGAYAVVVGGAITRPAEISARFARAVAAAGATDPSLKE